MRNALLDEEKGNGDDCMYTLQFDGLFRGVHGEDSARVKTGFMCYGWVILQEANIVARGHGAYARGKDATSNIAEYLALIEGLDALYDLGIRSEPVHIYGDAKGVIDQMRGEASVTSPSTLPMFRRASRLARRFENLEWTWVPRRDNRLADLLTRRAMRQVRLDSHSYQETVRAIHPYTARQQTSNKFLPVLDLRVYQPAS